MRHNNYEGAVNTLRHLNTFYSAEDVVDELTRRNLLRPEERDKALQVIAPIVAEYHTYQQVAGALLSAELI